jgi:hypothetical protein
MIAEWVLVVVMSSNLIAMIAMLVNHDVLYLLMMVLMIQMCFQCWWLHLNFHDVQSILRRVFDVQE